MNFRLVNENFQSDYGANILKSRGITDITGFLHPSQVHLNDWRNLNNIDAAVSIFNDTVNSDKPYALVVDCDCDGMTSAAMFYSYTHKINPNKQIDYYLHEGKQHGLEDIWESILNNNDYDVIWLPDAGTNDGNYVLNFGNTPVIVLDHHELENESIIPANMTIVNNQLSERYSNKSLSGVGVTWQFCRAVDELLNHNYAKDFMDLAALGIVADLMSMLSYENQYIVQEGLKHINNKFFQAILEKQAFSTGGKINPTIISFYVSPLINAMIRAGTAEEKERMFIAFIDGDRMVPSNKRGAKGTLDKVATESARECTNTRNRQNKMVEEAVENLEARIFKYDLLENEILFIRLNEEDKFPSTLNGLISMQLSAKYRKPTIVARLNDEGYVRGSARGVNDSALESFKDYLNSTELFEYTAGHGQAFGISINNELLTQLHNKANKELKQYNLGDNSYSVNLSRMASDKDVADIIYDLADYENCWGQMNSEPYIHIERINFSPDDIIIMGKNRDTVKLIKNGVTYIKFHAKNFIEEIKNYNESIQLEVIGRASLNEWNRYVTPQLLITDYEIRKAALEF